MDKKIFTVYKHTTPNNKLYIGITSRRPQTRWANGFGYRNNEYFFNAISKYGWDNIKHEILFENLTEEEAKLMEQCYIALYDSINPKNGYNQTLGGEGTLGYHMSQETKTKISNSKKRGYIKENHPNYGKRLPLETRRKISNSNKGKKLSEETRRKISQNHSRHTLGKHLSKETREKISKNHANVKGINNPGCKKVVCVTTGEVFNYIREAALKYNIKEQSNITACCKNKIRIAGHLPDRTPLVWRYYEDYLNMSPTEIEKILKYSNKWNIICMNDLNKFRTFKEAGNFYGIKNSSNIGKCCRGQISYCGKLKDGTQLRWMYYEDYLKAQ